MPAYPFRSLLHSLLCKTNKWLTVSPTSPNQDKWQCYFYSTLIALISKSSRKDGWITCTYDSLLSFLLLRFIHFSQDWQISLWGTDFQRKIWLVTMILQHWTSQPTNSKKKYPSYKEITVLSSERFASVKKKHNLYFGLVLTGRFMALKLTIHKEVHKNQIGSLTTTIQRLSIIFLLLTEFYSVCDVDSSIVAAEICIACNEDTRPFSSPRLAITHYFFQSNVTTLSATK